MANSPSVRTRPGGEQRHGRVARRPAPSPDGHWPGTPRRRRHTAGVIDGRAPGQKCVGLGPTRRVQRPQDRSVRLLPAQDEIDSLLNARPELAQELHVSGDEIVVPCAGRQVGAYVGVEPGVLDDVGLVVVEPAAVGKLPLGQPAVGRHRLVDHSAHGQRHGGLDVIPRVTMSTLEPRDHAVVALRGGDGPRRRQHFGGRHDARHLGHNGGGADLIGAQAASPRVGAVDSRRPLTPCGPVSPDGAPGRSRPRKRVWTSRGRGSCR